MVEENMNKMVLVTVGNIPIQVPVEGLMRTVPRPAPNEARMRDALPLSVFPAVLLASRFSSLQSIPAGLPSLVLTVKEFWMLL